MYRFRDIREKSIFEVWLDDFWKLMVPTRGHRKVRPPIDAPPKFRYFRSRMYRFRDIRKKPIFEVRIGGF